MEHPHQSFPILFQADIAPAISPLVWHLFLSAKVLVNLTLLSIPFLDLGLFARGDGQLGMVYY